MFDSTKLGAVNSLPLDEHFSHLLDLPKAQQDAYLLTLDDADVVAQLKKMLQANDGKDFDTLIGGQVSALTGDGSIENLTGTTIGAYTLKDVLGRGGMGIVYQADRTDGVFEQSVAIKFVYPSVTAMSGKETVFFEARCLGQLAHPNIVSIYDAGQLASGACYFVMEYLEGRAIHHYCEHSCQHVSDIVELVIQLCAAIDAAHKINIVHSDIKPNNVVINPEGQLKVLDFGIAKIMDSSISDPREGGEIRGATEQFASPEQHQHQPLTFASDIYSIGALLNYLINSHPQLIHASKTKQHELKQIIDVCMQNAPVSRYASVAQLQQDLRSWSEGRLLSFQPSLSYTATHKWIRRNTWLSALVVVLMCALPIASSYQYQLAIKQAQSDEVEKHLSSFIRYNDPAIAGQPMDESIQMLLDTYDSVASSTALTLSSQYSLSNDIIESLIGLGEYQNVLDLVEGEFFKQLLTIDDQKEFALTRNLIKTHILNGNRLDAYTLYQQVLNNFEIESQRERLLLGVAVSRALKKAKGKEGLEQWQDINREITEKSALFSKEELLDNTISNINRINDQTLSELRETENKNLLNDNDLQDNLDQANKLLAVIPATHPDYSASVFSVSNIASFLKVDVAYSAYLIKALPEIEYTYGKTHPIMILAFSHVAHILGSIEDDFKNAHHYAREAYERSKTRGYFNNGTFQLHFNRYHASLGYAEESAQLLNEGVAMFNDRQADRKDWNAIFNLKYRQVWDTLEFEPELAYQTILQHRQWLNTIPTDIAKEEFNLDAEKLFLRVLKLSLEGQHDKSIAELNAHQQLIDGSNQWPEDALYEYLYRKKGDFNSSLSIVDTYAAKHHDLGFIYSLDGLYQDVYLWQAQALAELDKPAQAAQLLQDCFDFNYELRAEADNFWLQVVATMSDYYQLPLDTKGLDVPLMDSSFLLVGGEQPVFGKP
jgi:serine/threonine protein kinase